jgi:hypothetical protein
MDGTCTSDTYIALTSRPVDCASASQYLDEGSKAPCAAGNLKALHANAASGLAAHVVVQRHQRLPLHCVLLPQEQRLCRRLVDVCKQIRNTRIKVQLFSGERWVVTTDDSIRNWLKVTCQQHTCRRLRHPAISLQ